MNKKMMRWSGQASLTLLMALTAPIVLGSCSEDEGLATTDTTSSGWSGFFDGQADPDNTWMTSVPVQVNITTPRKGTVVAQTIKNSKTVTLGEATINGSGTMMLDVPQSDIASFGLVFDDGTGFKQYQRIDLKSGKQQVANVKFVTQQPFSTPAKAPAKAATNKTLYGQSILPAYGYMNFGSWAWDDVARAVPENVAASRNVKALKDYEIMARGEVTTIGELRYNETVYLSFLYGHTGCVEKRILGYYVHSANADGTANYADIEFHDIADVMSYDYYDGKAKVQYQLDGVTSKWHDANFDYTDTPTNPNGAHLAARRGDDAYGTYNVNANYGNRITAVRSLTYKLEIPKGKVFGFYLKDGVKAISNDQKQKMLAAGVPADKLPTNLANYTKAAFNHGNNFKGIRSAFAIYDNFTFMGLDDTMDGGDGDCNDVTFALSNVRGEKLVPQFSKETTESEINKPTITNPDAPDYVNPAPDPTEKPDGGNTEQDTDYESLQHWTLAFENAGLDNDFDFNDVVLEVTPDTKNHKAYVYLMATGAMRHTEIYYQKSDGSEQFLGEVHQLFGVANGKYVNTTEGAATSSPVLVADDLEWPEGSTMDNSRHKFILKVYDDYESKQLSRIVRSSDLINGSPQVLCIAGHWAWPMETTKVHGAYPLLGKWAIDFNKTDNWNWHSHPVKSYTVTPLAPTHKK